nr:HAMP domain-containing sensor histidine kinase [Marinibactrum halimedae]
MRTGVIVISSEGYVQLINDAACKFVGLDDANSLHYQAISQCPILFNCFHEWKKNPRKATTPIYIPESNREVRINFAFLGETDNSDVLIFIEDNRQLAQEAQKLKLASLGKLTASIAHEIRNPLGAISHAAQLMAETPDLDNGNQRLTEIIVNHSKRVNQIIENTLQLSRRNQSKPEMLQLNEWLPQFIREYQEGGDCDITLRDDITDSTLANIKIDPHHFKQILTNLFDNGIRYSEMATGRKQLLILLTQTSGDEFTAIQVFDEGPGVDEKDIAHIFEPFYTTENTGSGLGLYICRELCESNQASLHYIHTGVSKSYFQISFAHAQQVF